MGTQPQQQSISESLSSLTQPQYLISSNNSIVPHRFTQIGHDSIGQSSAQIHPAGYHIDSNHMYQSRVQQKQNQARPPLFYHHKSPSAGDDNHSKYQSQNNELSDQELQHRQLYEQSNLPSSQSMPQGELRVRQKGDYMGPGLISGLENLDLDVEVMLMNEGLNNNNNNNNSNSMNANNQIMQNQQQPNYGQNIDKLLRSLVNQQNVGDPSKPNDCGDLQSSGYAGPVQQIPNCSTNNPRPTVNSGRSEDNIYEEIDMNRWRVEYPIDTISLGSDTWKKKNSKKFLGASFTRWFSTRKKSSNSNCSDQEENLYIESKSIKRPRLISLPDTMPENLAPEKLKRRLIVGSIIESENSYTNSLYRLIYEYKKPLEEADPPILSANKISIIFYCLDQILQFHKLFGLSLSHHVQEWDEKEMIGSVFTTNFSKPMVLEIYSGFINNFTNAMETARRASKSKAFAQFLHDKSISSPDRLSFFGSMVKPVQRFPQFILLLSDLLKHTHFNHPDRMPLQRALTELESLADRLNERKRDAERHFAVKQLLKDQLNESCTYSQRYLLRQDDICLLEMDPSSNTILKSKNRKIYLLNDMLICVSTPSNRLKFAVPLSDITVVESISPAVSNLLAHSNFKNLSDNPNALLSSQNYTIERMECERQSLVHDLEIMMNISALVASLRFQYTSLNPAAPDQICSGIREEIRKKEFQMTLIDKSCLQLRLNSKNHKDTLVVQFSTPESKRDWLIDIRLTKLTLDRSNNPGWENVTNNTPPTHQASFCSIGQRIPLFVKSLAIFKSNQSSLTCALHYYPRRAPFIGENPTGVLWICNVSAGASSLGALATNGAEISLIHSYELSDSHVSCLESVNATLWIGLRQGRIIVIDANSPGEWIQFASLDVQCEVTCIKSFGNLVYVGLVNGAVAIFDGINPEKPYFIELSPASPVRCLFPINDEIFACCHNRIWRIKETAIVDSLTVQNVEGDLTVQNDIIPLDEEPRPNLLAHCGNGIWISLVDSPIVKLYHAESFKHLVDIDLATSIRRVLNDFRDEVKISVTSMMATKGLLWIGTNVGMIATLTLPRLQGVPLVSGSINVALHRFLGPVTIMLNLSEFAPQMPWQIRQQTKPNNNIPKNEEAEAIYGQYADLLNVGDYITSGRKSGNLDEAQADRVAWEYPNVNISGMNISDDSGSNASSGAIYGQDGVARSIKQLQLQQQQQHQQQQQPNNPVVANNPQANMIPASVQNQNQMMHQNLPEAQQLESKIEQARYNQPVEQGSKTVMVLAGGNGYQRDNKPFGEHAHCIIWEYKP